MKGKELIWIRRTLCLILALSMIAVFMPQTAFTAYGATVTKTQTMDFTSMNNTVNDAEHWAWYKTAADGYAANTLVLSGIDISMNVTAVNGMSTGIALPAGSTVVLNGGNNLAVSGAAGAAVSVIGISTENGALTFNGNGSLAVNMGVSAGNGEVYGISAGTLNVDSGTVNATIGSNVSPVQVKEELSLDAIAVIGEMKVNGGNVTGDVSNCVDADQQIVTHTYGVVAGSITVTGGKLTGYASKAESSDNKDTGVASAGTIAVLSGSLAASGKTAVSCSGNGYITADCALVTGASEITGTLTNTSNLKALTQSGAGSVVISYTVLELRSLTEGGQVKLCICDYSDAHNPKYYEYTGQQGKWEYSNNTLKLNGFTYYTERMYALKPIVPVSIETAAGSSNVLVGKENGMKAYDSIVFKGEGSLMLKGEDYGLFMTGYSERTTQMTIESGTLTAEAGYDFDDSGIYAPFTSLSITGGTLIAAGEQAIRAKTISAEGLNISYSENGTVYDKTGYIANLAYSHYGTLQTISKSETSPADAAKYVKISKLQQTLPYIPALPTVTTGEVTFDQYKPADMTITQNSGIFALKSIKNGSYTLQPGKDYTVAGGVVTISKDYLAGLPAGEHKLTLGYSSGTEQTVSLTVKDTAPEHKINKAVSKGGSFAVAASAKAGDKVTLTVKADKGYRLKSILVNGKPIKGTSFVMPDKNTAVAVKFVKITFKSKVSSSRGGRVIGKPAAAYGGTLILRAVAYDGYDFVMWTENGKTVSRGPRLVVKNIKKAHSYRAVFEKEN